MTSQPLVAPEVWSSLQPSRARLNRRGRIWLVVGIAIFIGCAMLLTEGLQSGYLRLRITATVLARSFDRASAEQATTLVLHNTGPSDETITATQRSASGITPVAPTSQQVLVPAHGSVRLDETTFLSCNQSSTGLISVQLSADRFWGAVTTVVTAPGLCGLRYWQFH